MRLSTWDYSRAGYYFITICTKNKQPFFGRIKDGKMELNEIGSIAQQFWMDIPHHFDGVVLGEFVIMPNHIHGIVIVAPDAGAAINNNGVVVGRGAINRAPTNKCKNNGGITNINNPMGKKTLGEIIRWFKGRVSFELRKNPHHHFKWQRNYYDHIIRNHVDLNRIRKYIKNNPEKWHLDNGFDR